MKSHVTEVEPGLLYHAEDTLSSPTRHSMSIMLRQLSHGSLDHDFWSKDDRK